MPKYLTNDQQSPEWLAARRGRITASRINDVISFKEPSAAKAKEAGFKLVREAVAAGITGEEAAARRNYRMEIMAERLTGQAAEHYVTPAMEWGIDNEPWAIAAYELAFDVQVERVGFAVHPALDYSGASPDALVGSDGVLEVKCPTTTTHLEWMMAAVVPEEHRAQMFWEMACCERQWCDFVSFDPRLEPDLRVFTRRLQYDAAIVAEIQVQVMRFNDEVESAIAKLRGSK